MFKVTTTTNSEYQEFEGWVDFLSTNQVLHSYNDNPSAIDYYENGEVGCKWWHLENKLHRSNDKPSYINYYEDGKIWYEQWYLDDIIYTKQEYKQIMKQVAAMSDTEKLLDSRWWVREMVK